jgi:4-amino-4-deoxy-L-arabinose transferase-like glycosyltransferase
VFYLLLGILAVVLAFDLIEGISPPADADTLAYHFAIPKHFLAAGGIEFVPRAISGAIPLLFHLTYTAALGMGGEITLTLWAMATGWLPGLLLYGIARRFVGPPAALALAIVFLTTPAVLYSGGSGHIEARCAALVIAAAVFLIDGTEDGSWKFIAVAGILAGFFVGAKYFGLIFAGAAGLVLLAHSKRLQFAFVFVVAVVVAGAQWYIWNWWHTGDPVFPVLFQLLALPDTPFWTNDLATDYRELYGRVETPLSMSIVHSALYPVYATFDMIKALESGRTGFGVFLFLILPLAVAGAIRKGGYNRALVILVLLAGIFFTVWFFSGTTQRTRHLLPVYPLLLVAGYALACSAAARYRLSACVVVSLGLVTVIQLSGQGLFTLNHARYVFSGETSTDFLARNVGSANAVFWVNANLKKTDRVAYTNRELGYLFDVPSFMMHPHLQALVDFREGANDTERFVAQAKQQKLTYFLLGESWVRNTPLNDTPRARMMEELVESGCLGAVKIFPHKNISSRTLSQVSGQNEFSTTALYRFLPDLCPIKEIASGSNFLSFKRS